jgi:hypothetical protein
MFPGYKSMRPYRDIVDSIGNHSLIVEMYSAPLINLHRYKKALCTRFHVVLQE